MNKKILFLLLLMAAVFASCDDGMFDTYDNSVVYKVGDRGPAGGWIFYINPDYKGDGWRYLEAAPADLSGLCDWGSDNQVISGAYGTAIGTGKQNTMAIIAGDTAVSDKAADQCDAYRGGGYDDWFLPSKDELVMMHSVLGSTSAHRTTYDFITDIYFSSSELSAANAFGVNFSDIGESGNYGKNYPHRVRAIRAF